jgi:hypothetical protein
MSTFDSGQGSFPAAGVTTFTLPGGPVVEGLEVHDGGSTPTNPSYAVSYITNGAPNGTGVNPAEPSRAPNVDSSASYNNVTAAPFTPINSAFVFGVTGATVKFANPA